MISNVLKIAHTSKSNLNLDSIKAANLFFSSFSKVWVEEQFQVAIVGQWP